MDVYVYGIQLRNLNNKQETKVLRGEADNKKEEQFTL